MMGMGWELTLALFVGVLVALMGLGVPVAFAFLIINLVGAWFFLGGTPGLSLLAANATESIGTFILVPIPLFVLMGEIMLATGLATRAIRVIDRLITGVPGRLSIVAISSGTVFAALSGSSIANTAVLGRVLLPEMHRLGYHSTVSIGPILAIGGVAMLIPPSALAVLLGSLAGINISKLLIAGIIPGLLLAAFYFGYILVSCGLKPALAPADAQPEASLKERLIPLVTQVLPLVTIVIAVVGSILSGFATATESAALGCAAILLVAAGYRQLTWDAIRRSLMGTLHTSSTILIILACSITFSQVLAFSGASSQAIQAVIDLGLDAMVLVVAFLLIVIILGCIMDQLSIMLITLPFFVPLLTTSGVDLIWFAVMMLLALEIGLITPPFGLLLFVMKSVAPPGTTLRDILVSIVPYLLLEFVLLAFIFLFPSIALTLPSFL